jgi:hypothetical protein
MNDRNPLWAKNGKATILNGVDAGQKFQTNSIYTYY